MLNTIFGLILIIIAAAAAGQYIREWVRWRNYEAECPEADKALITLCAVAIAVHWWMHILGVWK